MFSGMAADACLPMEEGVALGLQLFMKASQPAQIVIGEHQPAVQGFRGFLDKLAVPIVEPAPPLHAVF